MKWEILERYRIDLIVPVTLIVLSEFMIFQDQMEAAMFIDALNLILLILSAIFTEQRIYVALMLLPLFRLLNVAVPVFFALTLYSYILVYLPMFLPIYFIMKNGIFSPYEVGITAKGFWFYLPLALALGLAVGWGEYQILKPDVLIPSLNVVNILILSLVMILFVGVVEEFIFRSSLQTAMEERLGAAAGLLFTSLIFGLMHSGYHITGEILYVSFVGILFGLLFWVTRSLPIIAMAHGFTNISLFMLVPVFPSLIIYLTSFFGLIFLIEEGARRLVRKSVDG